AGRRISADVVQFTAPRLFRDNHYSARVFDVHAAEICLDQLTIFVLMRFGKRLKLRSKEPIGLVCTSFYLFVTVNWNLQICRKRILESIYSRPETRISGIA